MASFSNWKKKLIEIFLSTEINAQTVASTFHSFKLFCYILTTTFTCPTCNRTCGSRIELHCHQKTHCHHRTQWTTTRMCVKLLIIQLVIKFIACHCPSHLLCVKQLSVSKLQVELYQKTKRISRSVSLIILLWYRIGYHGFRGKMKVKIVDFAICLQI